MVKILWKIKETGLRIKETLEDKQGIGVVVVIIIVGVVIGLVIILKYQHTTIVYKIFLYIKIEIGGI